MPTDQRGESFNAIAEQGTLQDILTKLNASIAVTGGGGTEYAVDTALGATPTGALAIAIRDDALSALTPVEGDAIGLRVDANGALWTHDDSLDAALTGTELQVDIVAALPTGTNAIGKLAANSGVDIGDVDILTMPNVTLAAGTNTNEIVGDVAHSAGVAGNPLRVCGSAQDQDDTAPPNRVDAESDATTIAVDRDGAVFVRPFGPQIWSYHDDDTAAVTTDGTVHAAPGANLSLYVTDVVFSIGAGTASSIFLEESTTKVLGPWYLEAIAGRSIHIRFATPKKITANTALLVTNTGSISFSVDVTGYTAQG